MGPCLHTRFQIFVRISKIFCPLLLHWVCSATLLWFWPILLQLFSGDVGAHEIRTQTPSILAKESLATKSDLSDNGYASSETAEPEVYGKNLPLQILAGTDARTSLLKGLGLRPGLQTFLRPRDVPNWWWSWCVWSNWIGFISLTYHCTFAYFSIVINIYVLR